MWQNSQASEDRVHAEHHYDVNLKAEIRIGILHERLAQLRDQKRSAGPAAGGAVRIL